VVAIVVAAFAGYFLWLRDSSLVAVTSVDVEGVESGERDRITAALTRAGKSMTTLNVDAASLEQAAARFPTIKSVTADASFPHGLRIEVVERPAALVASAGGKEAAVAADGTVLPGVKAGDELPRLEVDRLPGSGRLEDEALDEALVVGAAPDELAPLIRRVREAGDTGVEAKMRGGVSLRFGTGDDAAAKWAAAAAVLADPEVTAVSYVDVRVPHRPAVGGTS